MSEQEKAIKIYQEILSGQRLRFPGYFFDGKHGKLNLAYVTRYLIETYLEIAVEQIPRRVTADLL